MKMQEMNEAFEREGFDVKRHYSTDDKKYYFDITKDGIGSCGEFTWNVSLPNHVNNSRQEKFVKDLISTWEKAYEKFHSHPKPTPYDLYQLQRELAVHGGEAKLVVYENVYPVRINDVTIDSLAGEVPKVSVEGELRSFTPEDRVELAKEKHNQSVDSYYNILCARANGKSLMAAKQIYDMLGHSNPFAIEKVIFNGPATIVMWMDGTKTIVKCQDGDEFDPEKGLAMAISKKAFGNKGNYCDVFKKALKNCDVYYEETVNNDPHIGDIYNAYQKLLDTLNNKKATKSDLGIAMEEAIGYLGHVLG